jgi:hypothetical protein
MGKPRRLGLEEDQKSNELSRPAVYRPLEIWQCGKCHSAK